MQRQILALVFLCLACGDDGGSKRSFHVASCDPARVVVPDLRVVSFNLLHGIFCPMDTVDCRVAERVDLLFDWLESIDCPDVVVLQEVLGRRVEELVRQRSEMRCSFSYLVHEPPQRSQNFTLTRYPVLASHEEALLGGVRVLWHTRIDHPMGIVDVFNTHLAAGVDRGSAECSEECPEQCVVQGAVTNRDCQAVQVADLAERHAADGSLRVLAGDFNATPDSFVYSHLIDRGWVDAFAAAGHRECDSSTGVGCTAGRESEALIDLESPKSGVDRRIDYMFIHAGAGGAGGCTCGIDSTDDGDSDGVATGVFADLPNPFVSACGAVPAPICWPSDHEGMQLDMNCR